MPGGPLGFMRLIRVGILQVISLDYVKFKDNIADPLTKGLNIKLVKKSSRGMGLN